jgi:integrase
MQSAFRLFSPDLPPPENRCPTVAYVIGRYLDHAASRLSPRWLIEVRRMLADFAADNGQRIVESCRGLILEAWIDGHSQWGDTTKNGACRIVQRAFNWAELVGLIDRNPFKGISHQPGEPGEPMLDADVRKVLAASDASFRQVVIFLLFTGARPGEMAAIRRSDVRAGLEAGLPAAIVRTRHKTARHGKPRIICLHPVPGKLVAYLLRRFPRHDHVFCNSRGKPWTRNAWSLRMKRLRDDGIIAAGVRLYGLRHAFGTRMARAGVHPKAISEQMGHTTTRMTERYLHLAGDVAHLQQSLLKGMAEPFG